MTGIPLLLWSGERSAAAAARETGRRLEGDE
jgi:hypothetical protein